jgi:hypothetical protein
MATRRVLRGIVNDLAISFVGRSNDLDGYWAVGLLRLFADREGIRDISFDLVADVANPKPDLTQRVASAYTAWLKRRLEKFGLPVERMSRAELVVKFREYAGVRASRRVSRVAASTRSLWTGRLTRRCSGLRPAHMYA